MIFFFRINGLIKMCQLNMRKAAVFRHGWVPITTQRCHFVIWVYHDNYNLWLVGYCFFPMCPLWSNGGWYFHDQKPRSLSAAIAVDRHASTSSVVAIAGFRRYWKRLSNCLWNCCSRNVMLHYQQSLIAQLLTSVIGSDSSCYMGMLLSK